MKIEIIEQTIVLDLNERHEKAKCRISRLLANKRTNTRAGSLRAVSGLFLVLFWSFFIMILVLFIQAFTTTRKWVQVKQKMENYDVVLSAT